MDIVRNLLRAVAPYADGDLSDRFNYCYSTTIFVILSAFISGWSFVGTPIQCWFPAYYKGWWIEYALDYCFVQNTYFVPFTDVKPSNYFDIAEHIIPIPKNVTAREEKLIGYYQWVPFILALQAILFYLPVVLWRTFYNCNGVKVQVICDTCNIKSNMASSDRVKNMDKIAGFLAHNQTIQNNFGNGNIHHLTSGKLLIIGYLAIKLIYVLNAVIQFLLLQKLLGVESIWWGGDVLSDIMHGREWPETSHFPRVTLCDFTVRVLGNLHRHTVQCVLMINMFNEKIFIFVWFWLLTAAFLSIHSFGYWLFTSVTNYTGRKMIDIATVRGQRRKFLVDEFLTDVLRPDGLFLIRLIQANSGDLVTYELIKTLWQRFLESRIEPPPYSETTKKSVTESGL
uniref:Innexin n=1 Tax=Syphacia muris TaxID=451379 RepID=A0A0N5AAY5_9BILA